MVELRLSPSSISQLIRTGDDEDAVKSLVIQLSHDEATRRNLAAQPEIWSAFSEIPLVGQKVVLANNISACEEAGRAASDFRDAFVSSSSSGNRFVWQVLANLFKGYPYIYSGLDWAAGFSGDANLPALVLLRDIIDNYPEIIDDYASEGVFSHLLAKVPEWYDKDNVMQIVVALFKSLLSKPCFMSIFSNTRDFRYILMKIVDGIVALPGFNLCEPKCVSECIISTIPIEPVINAIDIEQRQSAIEQWCLMMCEFDILENIGIKASESIKKLLCPVVTLLNVSRKLPNRSKLRDEHPKDADHGDISDFVKTKTAALSILGLILSCDPEASDEVRDLGGLTTVLECCVIDTNQPYMKEHAIVCLRYLLQGNHENQKIVAGLEAKRLADPDALAQCGYEADIKNGEITLKKRN